jgi:hypothetical protein
MNTNDRMSVAVAGAAAGGGRPGRAGTTRSMPERDVARARKVARARALTDPLGAKGFRQTRLRVEGEGRLRRRAFVGSLATFVACFGIILGTHRGNGAAATTTSFASDGAGSVAAQLLPSDDDQASFYVPSQSQAPQRHVRTHSS